MGDGKAAAGVAQFALNILAERERWNFGADDPLHRSDVIRELGNSVVNLADRNVHHWLRLLRKRPLAHVGDDANHLTRGLCEFRTDAFANQERRTDRVSIPKAFFLHW